MRIDDCVTAYRNNKKEQSNIDFSAEVINSIVKYEEAYILVGDFTHFYDSLQHSLLKQRYGYYEKNYLLIYSELINK